MPSESIRAEAMVDAIEHVFALPAVPTRDWCQRGADSLGSILTPRHKRAIFAVGVGRGVETVESLEVSGVHATDASARRAVEQSVARHTPIAPRPEAGTELTIVTSRELARSDSWLRSPLMKVIAAQGMIGIMLGVGLVGGADPGRLLWLFGAAEAAAEGAVVGDLSFAMVVLLATLRRARLALGSDPSKPVDWISERERETLNLIVRGLSVREIAEQTGRSAHTVHDHVKSLHRKLQAQSRGELVARALGHLPMGTPPIQT